MTTIAPSCDDINDETNILPDWYKFEKTDCCFGFFGLGKDGPTAEQYEPYDPSSFKLIHHSSLSHHDVGKHAVRKEVNENKIRHGSSGSHYRRAHENEIDVVTKKRAGRQQHEREFVAEKRRGLMMRTDVPLPWDQARKMCLEMGGELASLTNEDEAAFVLQQAQV